MMASKSPDVDIAAQIIYDGSYDPCKVSSSLPGIKPKAFDIPPCDLSFVADFANGYCYRILDEMLMKNI